MFRRVCLAFLAGAIGALVAIPSAGASSGSYAPPRVVPAQITIPRIGVSAHIESLKFNSAQDVTAPYRWSDTAWYARGPRPGDLGRATIFGHLDSTCCPAVFWYLHLLHGGDLIHIYYPGNRMLSFEVMWQHTYLNTQMPLKFMFGSTPQRGLTLVTCAGVFHHDGTGYDHKLVVYARLVLPNGHLG